MSVRSNANMAISEAKRRSIDKWDAENMEMITIKFSKKKFTKEQLREVAEREGYKTINAWLTDLIKNNI